MKKKHITIGVVLILMVGGVFVFKGAVTENAVQSNSGPNLADLNTGVTTGKSAKDFSLTTIEGEIVRLSDFRGKTVIFAFMATWCVPCQIEAENVREVQKDNDYVVIQIDVDARENNQDLIDFRKEFGNKDWIMAFDKDLEIATPYNVKSFDTTLVVDPEGKIIYRDEGWPIDVKTLRDLLKGDFQQLVLGSTHEHADISVIISGQKIDFSQKKYQLRSPFVHFEDNDGKTVHVHAEGVTVGYLFGTLGWEYNEPCIITDFSEVCNGGLTVRVNGVEKNLDYELNEGDVVEVVYGEPGKA